MTSCEGNKPQDMPTLVGAISEIAFGSVPQTRLPQYRDSTQLRDELRKFSLRPNIFGNLLDCEDAGWNVSNVFPLVVNGASKEQLAFADDFLDFVLNTPKESPLFAVARIDDEGGNVGITARIHEVVNSDSQDARAWWGFAPYVHSELIMNRKLDVGEAMHRLLLWARDGNINDPGDIHLQGLSFLREGRISASMYRLSKNPDGESHRFTRLKAVGIADILLTKEEFNPETTFD